MEEKHSDLKINKVNKHKKKMQNHKPKKTSTITLQRSIWMLF